SSWTARSSFGSASANRRLNSSAAPITLKTWAEPAMRAEAQRGLGKLDRPVELTGKKSENGTYIPTASKARIERQRSVYQRHHGADVFAIIAQREGGIGKDGRIVAGRLQGSPGVISALAPVFRGVGAGPIRPQPETADGRPGERRPITRIARDRPLEQTQRL